MQWWDMAPMGSASRPCGYSDEPAYPSQWRAENKSIWGPMSWTAAIALLAAMSSGVPAPKYGSWECHMQSMMSCPRDGGCSEVAVEPGILRLDEPDNAGKAHYAHCSPGKARNDYTIEAASVSEQPSVTIFRTLNGWAWARVTRDWTVTEVVNHPDLTLIAFGKCENGPPMIHLEVPPPR